jgi:dienelactone hydrolase
MKTLLNLFLLFGLISIAACNNNSKESQSQKTPGLKEFELASQEISYSTDSTEMKGYLAYDANQDGKRPGIIVIHEWWGHNQYVRDRANKLAELGYVAFALDMYGDGKLASHPEDAGKFSGMVMSNMNETKARFEAAVASLKSNDNVDAENIGAIGYCFGGSVALTMANLGYDLDAVAAFHSGVQLPFPPSEDIKAKILVANGADDPFIPAESVNQFKEAMDKVGADYEYVAYEGVVHSFTSPYADSMGTEFGLPLVYNEEADNDSWKKLQDLFDRAFAK